jgi:hypothetical protein
LCFGRKYPPLPIFPKLGMLSGSDGGLFHFGRPTRSDTPDLSLSFREQRCVQIAHVA